MNGTLLKSGDMFVAVSKMRSSSLWLYVISNGAEYVLIVTEDADYLPFRQDGNVIRVQWKDGYHLELPVK